MILVICTFGSDGVQEKHKDYTGSDIMSLRPVRGCSSILHLFAIGGYKRRESESRSLVLCVCSRARASDLSFCLGFDRASNYPGEILLTQGPPLLL